MRKSHVGPYPHFLHAEHLPHDLVVKQFTIDDENTHWAAPLFCGHIESFVGDAPPAVRGRLDWVLLAFWVPYLIGVVAITWALFGVIAKIF